MTGNTTEKFLLFEKKWGLSHDVNYRSKNFGSQLTSCRMMITGSKCNIHLEDSVKDALCKRQDSAFWSPTYTCSNSLYENAECDSDNLWVLTEVARQKYFPPWSISIFWFRPADRFELGWMNHHIQYVNFICIFKYSSFQIGTRIHSIANIVCKKTKNLGCHPLLPPHI